jgi:hypothetical protein
MRESGELNAIKTFSLIPEGSIAGMILPQIVKTKTVARTHVLEVRKFRIRQTNQRRKTCLLQL